MKSMEELKSEELKLIHTTFNIMSSVSAMQDNLEKADWGEIESIRRVYIRNKEIVEMVRGSLRHIRILHGRLVEDYEDTVEPEEEDDQ